MIFSVDPGTTHSGVIVFDEEKWKVVLAKPDMPNEEVLDHVRAAAMSSEDYAPKVVCEWIEAMGMSVGKETFLTVRWIGRLEEAMLSRGRPFHTITRREVKLTLCRSMLAKDKNIRQALIDRFGGSSAIGKKKNQGPLFGVSSHAWSALAVVVTWLELQRGERRPLKDVEANPFSS